MEFATLKKWDLIESTEEKNNGLKNVLDLLEKHDIVMVGFDYEGRTRHETAANILKGELEKLGYKFRYEIDGYIFKIFKD